MNVVDSSGWLEYFADGPNADFFAKAIEEIEEIEALIVPAISIYEVFKRVYQQRGEGDALQAAAMMEQGQVIELDTPLALKAAKILIDFKIPMADSIILATAQSHNAILWTQDIDFKGIDGAQIHRKSVTGVENLTMYYPELENMPSYLVRHEVLVTFFVSGGVQGPPVRYGHYRV